jgi:hypothetical protein
MGLKRIPDEGISPNAGPGSTVPSEIMHYNFNSQVGFTLPPLLLCKHIFAKRAHMLADKYIYKLDGSYLMMICSWRRTKARLHVDRRWLPEEPPHTTSV